MKRVKLVTMINRPGATDRTVRTRTSWTMRPVAVPSPGGISDSRLGHLRKTRNGRQQQKRQAQYDGDPSHSTINDWMMTSRTLPSLRIRARSFRSSRRC